MANDKQFDSNKPFNYVRYIENVKTGAQVPLEDTPDNRAKAEQFADLFEAAIARRGAIGDFFCADQRKRWREHAIRAFMGNSPDFARGFSNHPDEPPSFPPPLPSP